MIPPHAYIPGQTARHPDALFDPLKQDVTAGLTPESLSKTTCFKTGLAYLESGYFWEAHELFEPVWMVLPEGSHERQFVQALIQLANGRLKVQMGRDNAARKLGGIVVALCDGIDQATVMGCQVEEISEAGTALLNRKLEL